LPAQDPLRTAQLTAVTTGRVLALLSRQQQDNILANDASKLLLPLLLLAGQAEEAEGQGAGGGWRCWSCSA
jgi:hypothetical protein